jgi:hypothetical protein
MVEAEAYGLGQYGYRQGYDAARVSAESCGGSECHIASPLGLYEIG